MSTLPGPHGTPSHRLRPMDGERPTFGILVADDEPTVRTLLVGLLTDEGYTTLQASDGAEALDLLRASARPLVVLLDWMMPGLDGLTVLQIVAADPVLARRHAYLFTSAAFPAGLRQLAALPPTFPVDVLIQPFNITVLLSKVEQAVERLAMEHRAPDVPHQQA